MNKNPEISQFKSRWSSMHIKVKPMQCTGPIFAVFLILIIVVMGPDLWADTHYVAPTGANSWPYTNWVSAARTIQTAIDVASSGDTVMVSNGLYNSGTHIYDTEAISNRVIITDNLFVTSVNGPEVTIIEGARDPYTLSGFGTSAVRCVRILNAALDGFTIRGGFTCKQTSGSYLDMNGAGICGLSRSATVSNCIIEGNTAYDNGGGAYGVELSLCLIQSNSAAIGGGAYDCELDRTRVLRNGARHEAGGAYDCFISHSVVMLNSARNVGGVVDGSAYNSIIYDNTYHNHLDVNLRYCCTTPTSGISCIEGDPCMVDSAHIERYSPCVGAGGGGYLCPAVDIDGEYWSDPPSIGCDEQSIHASGTLAVAIMAPFTNISVGKEATFYASINGHALVNKWSTDIEGTLLSNALAFRHTWMTTGTYALALTAYNLDSPGGVSSTVTLHVVERPVFHVVMSNSTPVLPYDSWDVAATSIQDAVDAATIPGSLVLVSNGIYATGGRCVQPYALTNRIVVDFPVTVQSVNGPGCTFIEGAASIGGWPGLDAVRCLWLGDQAEIAGFTLIGGHTIQNGDEDIECQSGGGVWCESYESVLTNCLITSCSSSHKGGGVYGGYLNACELTGNTNSDQGGGAAMAILEHCAINGNQSSQGSGVYDCTIKHSTLANNTNRYGSLGVGANSTFIGSRIVSNESGGIRLSEATDCLIAWNNGSGASQSTLINCILRGNETFDSWASGGASLSTLIGCLITENRSLNAGGANNSTLVNCTLTGNHGNKGYAVWMSSLSNCISYYNSPNMEERLRANSDYSHTCTEQLTFGPGNIDDVPQFADMRHLAASSPCIAAGVPYGDLLKDMDGDTWFTPPSMGCDEYNSLATGGLSVTLSASQSVIGPGWPITFCASIYDHASSNVWSLSSGICIATNVLALSYTWTLPGTNKMILTAYNDDNPGGISATASVCITPQSVFYVDQNNSSPSAPYSSWGIAATNIQDAIDAVITPGSLVLVSNGTYCTGITTTNYFDTKTRVRVDVPIMLRSVNGPASTIIEGAADPNSTNGWNAVRCVRLCSGAILSGFTLRNGHTRQSADDCGGAVWCASSDSIVTNCVLVDCSADVNGGAICGGMIRNCTFSSNEGYSVVYRSTLYDSCFTSNNSERLFAACVDWSWLSNCFLSSNSMIATRNSILQDCMIVGNYSNGGACDSWLLRCMLIANQSENNYNAGGASDNSWLRNCVVKDNEGCARGGGVYKCFAVNSLICENTAGSGAGGYESQLINCTIVGNTGTNGAGAAYRCGITNSIVFYNMGSNIMPYCKTAYSCAENGVTNGMNGNITNAPLFVDHSSGKYQLQVDSPCIDAGLSNLNIFNDLAGIIRPLDGNANGLAVPDMGAYEFVHSTADTDMDGLSDTNEIYTYKTNPLNQNSDNDPQNDWEEMIAGVDPNDGSIWFTISNPNWDIANTNIVISWPGAVNRHYTVFTSTNLQVGWTNVLDYTDMPGYEGTMSYTNSAPTNWPCHYRVKVNKS